MISRQRQRDHSSGDGCGFAVQKRMAEWVDGKQVYIEGEPLVSASES